MRLSSNFSKTSSSSRRGAKPLLAFNNSNSDSFKANLKPAYRHYALNMFGKK
jgi:hypothetical protein